jgi:hypothetical protein
LNEILAGAPPWGYKIPAKFGTLVPTAILIATHQLPTGTFEQSNEPTSPFEPTRLTSELRRLAFLSLSGLPHGNGDLRDVSLIENTALTESQERAGLH